MERSLVEIMPLALAAALSPTGFLIVIKILSNPENPARKALTFLVGAALLLTMAGALVLLTFRATVEPSSSHNALSSAIDIALGLLILVILARSLWLRRHPRPTKKEKQHKQPYVVFGFFYMLTNTSSLIPFIAASKHIASSGEDAGAELLLLAVVEIVAMSLISLPVALTYLAPAQATRVMAPVKSFMSRYGTAVAQAFFLLIAVYLIAHGALTLAG